MMRIETQDLVTINNFALEQKKTTQCIYNWINRNVVKCIEIDGVKFIVRKKPGTKPGL